MDFTYTAEQEMLRDSVARVLSDGYDFETRRGIVRSGLGRSPKVWRQLRELGLMALPFEESVGGLGGSIVDVVAVQEVLGAALVVDPYWSSTLLGGRLLAAAPGHALARTHLDRLIHEDLLIAFAHEERAGTADFTRVATRAVAREGRYVLDGEKRVVLGAAEAGHLIVSARLAGQPGDRSGLALLLVDIDQPGLSLSPFQTIDGRNAAHVRFDAAEVSGDRLLHAHAAAAQVLESVLAEAVIALCAEAVGAMQGLLTQTAQYTHTRRQFGVPIASFQTVAHRLADMKIAFSKARASLLYTTAMAEAGRAGSVDLAILKGQTGRLGRAIGEAAIQSHGGIGMTDELMIGHLFKRILVVDALLGASDHQFRMVGRA